MKFIMWMMWVTQFILHILVASWYHVRESFNALKCDSSRATGVTSCWGNIAGII
jgi:hypothetical protein